MDFNLIQPAVESRSPRAACPGAKRHAASGQFVARRLLEKHGHTVTVAGNGYEAVSLLDREAFDLVLMDVQMPEMDGFEATAAIRVKENGTGRHIPIIAMTAHA